MGSETLSSIIHGSLQCLCRWSYRLSHMAATPVSFDFYACYKQNANIETSVASIVVFQGWAKLSAKYSWIFRKAFAWFLHVYQGNYIIKMSVMCKCTYYVTWSSTTWSLERDGDLSLAFVADMRSAVPLQLTSCLTRFFFASQLILQGYD